MARTFVGFGFGPIQAGLFLAEARASGNFDRLVVAEIMPDVVKAVRECDGFMVNVATKEGIERERIEGVDVYNPCIAQDARHLVDAIAEARTICTALPSVDTFASGSPAVVELLSRGLRERMRRDTWEPCLIYLAENHTEAAEQLQEALADHLDDELAHYVKNHCRFLNTVIGKMCQVLVDGEQIDDKKLERAVPGLDRAFLVESFNRILVTAPNLTPAPRGIDVFVEKANLQPFEEAKLYGHNAVHALIGYLAREQGIDTMPEALADPTLREFARDAYLYEAGAALITKHAGVDPLFTPDAFREHVNELLERMACPYLEDSINRVIRDPARKLGWNDRLIGTIRLALEADLMPRRFAKAAAAALRMLEPNIAVDAIPARLGALWGDVPEAQSKAVIDLVTDACKAGAEAVVAASPKPLRGGHISAARQEVAALEKQRLLGPLFIGLDMGSTAIKGAITNREGTVLAETVRPTALRSPQAGWMEIDPTQYYQAVCQVIRTLTTTVSGDVASIAIAAASGNTLLSDADGKPLRPIISWMDQRTTGKPSAAIADLDPTELAQVTGWPCIDSFPLAHLAWLHEHEPQRFKAAAHVGMDADWLLYRLTGAWRVDRSTATTFHLVDQVKGAFHPPFLARLDLPLSKLPELVDSGTPIGTVTTQAARETGLSQHTVVIAGSFDHPAAARAAGITEAGQLMLSCGTSWVGLLPHADREVIINAGLLCDTFLSGSGGPWAGMFSFPQIGRAIDWYVANVIAPEHADPMAAFNTLAAKAEPGASGLMIDLREAPSVPDAIPENIARAVMEGAARLLAERLRDLAQKGLTFDAAVMVGGASRSPVWPKIVAETTGLNVTVGGRSAGARGAALLAAEAYDEMDNQLAEVLDELYA